MLGESRRERGKEAIKQFEGERMPRVLVFEFVQSGVSGAREARGWQ